MTPRRRVAAAALLVVLVALVILSQGVHAALLRGLAEAERVAAAHPVWAMAIVVAFSALGAMLAFVSSWVVVPFAVFTWGAPVAFLLLWSGWLLGGAGMYTIGRWLGRPAARWLTSPAVLARYEDRISHRTPFGFVLLAQFALPSEIPGYLLGIVRYPFLRYLAALALVELTYGIATLYLGLGVVERRITPVLAGGAALAVITILAILALRRRLAHPPEQAGGPPQHEGTFSAA